MKQPAGAYLAALRAGLRALAPNADFVPAREAEATLQLLDSATSGELAGPPELDPQSGMPALAWLLRARGALVAAAPASREELARARRLDPAIAARMESRTTLAALRDVPILPTSRLRGAVRRRGRTTDFLLTFDRMAPDGLWVRTRVDLTGPAGWEDSGPVGLGPDGTVRLHDGLSHLFGRHILTPIGALCLQLQEGTGALVTRLSRGAVGPFWFPGQPLPDGVPAALGRGLVLHGAREILGHDVGASVENDPLHRPSAPELLPDGHHLVRERRFAATPSLHAPLRRWAESVGCPVTIARLMP